MMPLVSTRNAWECHFGRRLPSRWWPFCLSHCLPCRVESINGGCERHQAKQVSFACWPSEEANHFSWRGCGNGATDRRSGEGRASQPSKFQEEKNTKGYVKEKIVSACAL